jgi:hypothetical protein
MAGEWLKFDSTLPEKQETLAITVAMGWDDPDLTVGKLMRLFRWFDQHTVDGNAMSVTPALLDRIVGVSGFVSAVAAQKWLIVTDTGICLHHFEYHNGASAKSRALTAKRVATHKSNAKANAEGNADTVSDALPREEKRREEKKEEGKASPRGSRLSADWTPSIEEVGYCRTTRPDLNPETVAADFRDYWSSKPGKDGLKLDWHATWQMWVRNQRAPKPGVLTAAGVVSTVPGRQERDPELVKREQDSKTAAKPPAEILALADRLRVPTQGARA